MQVTIKTPFGESNLEMEADKVQALYNLAVKFATSSSAEGEKRITEGEKRIADDEKRITAARSVAKQPVETVKAENKPHRRIDSLFGHFSASQAQRQTEPEPGCEENRQDQEGYRGFLIIRCAECGQTKGFCAKTPITTYRCDCGARTELHDLKRVFMNCKCGSTYKYKTNITDERFEHTCLNCGSPVDLQLNGRRNTYITITG